MTSFISKETIHRLLKDVKQMIKQPLTEQGIYYIHDDTDMLKGYAMIVGPSETPYFGGFYFFEFTYPADYPHSPPSVKYCTNENNIRFNPNLYTCGKVCVSLLNTWSGEQWTSCQTISTVLLTLCILLCNEPLLNEPGVKPTRHNGAKNPQIAYYNEVIEFSNIYTAVCSIMERKNGVFLPFFELFYAQAKELFIKNCPYFIEFVQNKIKESNGINKMIVIKGYQMTRILNYSVVLDRLKELSNV
jgi:ubiquitin-protein ligase